MKLNSLNWKAAAITATSAQVRSLKKIIFCTFSYIIVFYYAIVNEISRSFLE